MSALGGIGSRGGKIIGYFKTGRPIYQSYRDALKGGRTIAKSLPVHAVNARAGGIAGLGLGFIASGAYQVRALSKVWPKLKKDMLEHQVATKETVSGLKEFRGVEVISSRRDLEESKTLTNAEKRYVIKSSKKHLGYGIDEITGGQNAAAWKNPDTGKEYVFASEKVNKQVLGHELGHIRDFREGKIDRSTGSFTGILKGRQVASETRAWDKSPFKGKDDEPVRTNALETYKINRRAARIIPGFSVVGTVGAVAYGIVARKFK